MMDNKTIENRLHLFEDVASDNHDTIYEVVSAFFALCRLLSQKEILTSDEFNSIVSNRRYHPPTETKPVIHAHWTRKRTLSHDGELYCSNCEWTPEVLGGTTLGDLQLADVYYCPHCSAKMDEEAEG